MRTRPTSLALATTVATIILFATSGTARSAVVEDFEIGTVALDSYPGQDEAPAAWELTTDNTFAGSAYALRIYGNSWKTEEISPAPVSEDTVWQVAIYLEILGETQAFGVSDGVNELIYTFGGNELPSEENWWTVYQGAFPSGAWYAYLLPIGRDWLTTYGYTPTIDRLVYVNDDDSGGDGVVLFDEILDVTADLPVPPEIEVGYTLENAEKLPSGFFRVGIQFHLSVLDPDSDFHTFSWDFGDSTVSQEQNPVHEFVVEAEHPYTVGAVAKDAGGLAGRDTCQITVDPGPGDPSFTMNFVGDIFTGRAYEYSGGLIETYGIDALFEPTYSIFGHAADVSVANLECSYTDRGTRHPTKSVVFRSRPENIIGIRNAGIDVVTIGNNHIVDYGVEGLLQTQDLLDSIEVAYSGAGTNSYFANQPTFWTEDGVRVALLGLCNRTGRTWNYQPFLDAGYNKPGFANLLPGGLRQAIDESDDQADILIVQTHSGDEYETAPPAAGERQPPRVEANLIAPGDPDFAFRIEPSPGERELRRLALDLGADVLINHHPHVLQGFESYDGKLIAHSLGNFLFDLYYPETMPTLVLTLEMEADGIVGYQFTPAWIDDYIPQPATGQLAREIMDRMADYSRPMGALVAVELNAPQARIHLTRAAVDSVVTERRFDLPLVEAGSYRTTAPAEVGATGSLSGILDLAGSDLSNWDVRWGREILWHGGFEDEGATFWDDNTEDEWLDESESYRGLRSLALRRRAGNAEPVGTDLEKHLPCDPAKEHSASGWMKIDNGADATIRTRFYESRYSSAPLSSTDLQIGLTGSQDWSRQWRDLVTPTGADYFELRCHNDVPGVGTGHAWFDELKLIEWEPWVSGGLPIAIESPNNYRFIQVRTTEAEVEALTVVFEETRYGTGDDPASIPASPGVSMSHGIRSSPNPFSSSTQIILEPGVTSEPVVSKVEIYDARGRRVARVFDGVLDGPNRYVLEWDGKDDRGIPLPSGVYFSRVEVGQENARQKLILVR